MAKLGNLEKGNVMLKYCGLTTKEIESDVNSEKTIASLPNFGPKSSPKLNCSP